MLSKDRISPVLSLICFHGLSNLFRTFALFLCRTLQSLDNPSTETQEEGEKPSNDPPRHGAGA